MQATIIRATGSWYDAQLQNTETKVQCRLRGKFRLDNTKLTNPVAVGDHVVLEKEANQDTYSINQILPRRNYVVRSDPHKKAYTHIIAANIDNAIIVATIAYPRTSTGFIDRMLTVCEAYHIRPIIVFNKIDLYNDKETSKLNDYTESYRSVGYTVIHTSTVNHVGLAALHLHIKQKINLLCGHSGVGKSATMNVIYPTLNLRIGSISNFSGKGMHTTTFAEWFNLGDGGAVIDTPGVKELGLSDMQPGELSTYLPDLHDAAKQCRYNSCLHANEPDCGVKRAVEAGSISMLRYNGYLSMLGELQLGLKKWQKK